MKDVREVVLLMEHLEKLTPEKIVQELVQGKITTVKSHPKDVALTALALYEHTTERPTAHDRARLLIAALGHDVGKNGIKEEILGKPKTLSHAEYGNMQTHTEKTLWLLKQAFKHGDIPIIAASHHEHWDGSGYPQGLSEDKIHRLARIITIADVWSAISHKRVYQERLFSPTECIAIMESLRGNMCDPHLLDSFLNLIKNSSNGSKSSV